MMPDDPKRCPKCKIEWGVRESQAAKPKDGDIPAKPAVWRCDACYHHWLLED
jgi:hypothetical protein